MKKQNKKTGIEKINERLRKMTQEKILELMNAERPIYMDIVEREKKTIVHKGK